MAISTESANLAWQRVNISLDSLAASKAAREQFRQLHAYLAQEKQNPDLQFVAISDLGVDAVIADAACKIYGIYLKKSATATGCFFKAADHATSAGTTASDVVHELNAASMEDVMTYPKGYAQGTGFTVGADTTADGSTASTSGDGPNGFVLLGKP